MAYAGLGAILVSALLTAVYMMTVVVRAFFPGKDFDAGTVEDAEDPNWMMLLPLGIVGAVIFYLGFHSGPLMEVLENIAGTVGKML